VCTYIYAFLALTYHLSVFVCLLKLLLNVNFSV